MPNRLSVSMNRVEVNCVPLSVVSVKFASRPAPLLRERLRSGNDAKDSIPRFLACSSRSRILSTPSPLLDPPRSSSYPTARSDSAQRLPHGPTLSSVLRVDDASAPTVHVLASLVTPACDSHADLSSAIATTPLSDSRTPTFLRTPRRSAHRRFDRLGCLVASSGHTDSSRCSQQSPLPTVASG